VRATGALLLLFDVARDAVVEHDDWHTHEHMPERLAIPGFLRGTRWTRSAPGPRYCVVYEVANPAALDSVPYRARLDAPTPWTARMMTRYSGMRRTLCEVAAANGCGIGSACLVVTFAAQAGRAVELLAHLADAIVPALPRRRGLAGCRLLVQARAAGPSRERAIRGRDAAVQSALWITGYDADALARLAGDDVGKETLAEWGATDVEHAIFRLAFALTAEDCAAP